MKFYLQRYAYRHLPYMVIVCIKLYTISDHYLAHGVDVEKLLPQSSVQKKRGHWGGGGGGGISGSLQYQYTKFSQ